MGSRLPFKIFLSPIPTDYSEVSFEGGIYWKFLSLGFLEVISSVIIVNWSTRLVTKEDKIYLY